MWSILWVVCLSTDLCAQFNMVSEPWWTRNFSSLDILLDHFWAKLLLPALHQKQKVYHLIPQVKELLINLLDQLCWVWWKPEMCKLSNLTVPFFLFCRYNFEMNSLVPLLTQSSDYFEWNVKMFVFLNKQDLYWVYDRFGRESFESENDWLNA